MISGERRLTPVTRVVATMPMQYVLAVAAATVGLAIALVVGAFPVSGRTVDDESTIWARSVGCRYRGFQTVWLSGIDEAIWG
ncbi:hypothetical protein ACIPVK_20145 [Paeniglutamicibacter sp. MACA_103]|uniref:hypothetical protein n=1 Tax=Paeniglutamicibacter sp. MACA_103 TaxID=3377337 RepID=UPI0038963C99